MSDHDPKIRGPKSRSGGGGGGGYLEKSSIGRSHELRRADSWSSNLLRGHASSRCCPKSSSQNPGVASVSTWKVRVRSPGSKIRRALMGYYNSCLSGIRNPGSRIQDPESRIRTPGCSNPKSKIRNPGCAHVSECPTKIQNSRSKIQ